MENSDGACATLAEEFPITTLCESEGFFAEGVRSAAGSIHGSLLENDFTTSEGGFFVHVKCTTTPENVEVEMVSVLNALLASHEEVWRLEDCRMQLLTHTDPPYTRVLVLLFRMVDMYEALSF